MRGMVSDGKINGAVPERGTRDLTSRWRVPPIFAFGFGRRLTSIGTLNIGMWVP
jgi:hypothetical protein